MTPASGGHDATFLSDRMVLEIASGPGAGQRFPIGSVARLGRANGNEVQLFDAEVSRLHAVVYEYEQGFAIVDQASVNGTFVNGVRIAGPTWIKPGDEIRVGRSAIRVSSGAGNPAPASAAVDERPGQPAISTWMILAVLAGGGLLLIAAAAVVYLFFF